MSKSEIVSICQNEYYDFLSKDNVIGMGYGSKYINGFDSGEECITVLVNKKVDSFSLNPSHIIPKYYKNFKTDVIEVGDIYATALTARTRPVIFGYSIGPADLNLAGTAGYVVSDSSNNYYILSNNHVLAGDNSLPIGSSILQPAILDGGRFPQDVVATLSKFIPLQFQTSTASPTNTVDCAIAKVANNSILSNSIANIGKVNGINTSPRLGLSVKKSGRSSSFTTGIILALNSTITINYSNGKSAVFINQIITSSMASAGDSGSLLVDNNNLAVGLLFAGSSVITAYNPINSVFKALNIHLP